MKEIEISDLEKLMKEGFVGKIRIRGAVHFRFEARGSESLDAPLEDVFYESIGKFSINPSEDGEKRSYLLSNGKSHFYFKIANEEGELYNDDPDSPALVFSVDYPLRSVMQIEPEKILF